MEIEKRQNKWDANIHLASGNFCARYLKLLKDNKVFDAIVDGDGIEIDTIKVSSQTAKFIYRKPRLVYDKFGEKDRSYIEPKITRISYKDMRRLGFVIVARIPRRKWFRGQNVVYKLAREGAFFAYDYLLTIPKKHIIEFDSANSIIRICGKNSGVNGFSEWLEVGK